MKHLLKYIIILLLFSFSAKGNNVQVGNVAFAEQDVGAGEVSIQFDISWDNSWRVSSAPNNWDAVWLFVKYKSVDGTWHHATLSQNNNSTGSQVAGATLNVRGDNIGAYFYRSGDGTGTFSSSGVKLRWNYLANGIACNLGKYITEVKVFAIEMVYITQGSFYVGSGGTEAAHFYTYGSNNPYQITSEASIVVGTQNGNLYYFNDNAWEYGGDQSGPIPAAFPKGFNAFYCMKYEITQEQYCDFLNTLTSTQQSDRYTYYFNGFRYFIKLVNGIYGCDANNNNILDEYNDGQNIACGFMNWKDGCSYADWAGLRPITELEREKIDRGTLYPVPNEFPWGNTIAVNAGTNIITIINQNQPNEYSSIAGANCNFNDDNWLGGDDPAALRAGCFATAINNRQNSGASYYGVMEMGGNLFERYITVGSSIGRQFTNTNGNGILDNNGNADIINWAVSSDIVFGHFGGCFGSVMEDLQISHRFVKSYDVNIRFVGAGFRCGGGS